MTCQDNRDLFSAHADDALSGEERAQLDTHLATCPDCQREWHRFERTVGLLRAVEPARAPAGFVDRVLAARPQPWYRRLARGLFIPWTVKIPVEAAAVVLVAGLAVMLFQRSPELRQAARAPEALPPVAAPAPGSRSDREPLAADRSRDAAPSESLKDQPPGVAEPPVADRRSPESRRADAESAVAPPSAPEPRPPEREPTRESRVEPRSTEAPPTALRKQTEPDAARRAPSPAAPPAAQAPAEQKAAKAERLSSPMGAIALPADVQARLAVTDRGAAEREISSLVARLGGTVVARRADALDLTAPREAWDELTRELGRLGTLGIERRPADLPPTVRLTLRFE